TVQHSFPTRRSSDLLREKLRLGDSNLSIRRDQDLLGLSNIRTPLDDRRWQARWNFRRQNLFDQRKPAGNIMRVVTDQNADGVFRSEEHTSELQSPDH